MKVLKSSEFSAGENEVRKHLKREVFELTLVIREKILFI
jgi:hypothetical protein